jgi:hypothetical protein
MPTRFYFGSTDNTNAVNAIFDPGWEQTGQATRRKLYYGKNLVALEALTDKSVTVPITTTQDILNVQFVSDPLPPQSIEAGILTAVVRCSENATTNNAFLALTARIMSNDGQTLRANLLSLQEGGSEFPVTASPVTKIVGNGTTTAVTTACVTQPGDRLVIEIGVFASGPTAGGSAIERFGNNAASDFALTAGLTTDLNPWVELSQNLFPPTLNNYMAMKVGDGMSTGEKIK